MLKPEIPGFTLCRRGLENAFSAGVVCLTRIYTSGTERRSDPSLVAEKSKLEQRIESIQDQKQHQSAPKAAKMSNILPPFLLFFPPFFAGALDATLFSFDRAASLSFLIRA